MPGQKVYVGGVKNFGGLLIRGGLFSAYNFVGCLRNFELNGAKLADAITDSQEVVEPLIVDTSFYWIPLYNDHSSQDHLMDFQAIWTSLQQKPLYSERLWTSPLGVHYIEVSLLGENSQFSSKIAIFTATRLLPTPTTWSVRDRKYVLWNWNVRGSLGIRICAPVKADLRRKIVKMVKITQILNHLEAMQNEETSL